MLCLSADIYGNCANPLVIKFIQTIEGRGDTEFWEDKQPPAMLRSKWLTVSLVNIRFSKPWHSY